MKHYTYLIFPFFLNTDKLTRARLDREQVLVSTCPLTRVSFCAFKEVL